MFISSENLHFIVRKNIKLNFKFSKNEIKV
uniref:Uncharacterized protein n=1 Tax=Anguilla anguilla TaxID=7936 RepID=A0A0E9TGY9_ANGAN